MSECCLMMLTMCEWVLLDDANNVWVLLDAHRCFDSNHRCFDSYHRCFDSYHRCFDSNHRCFYSSHRCFDSYHRCFDSNHHCFDSNHRCFDSNHRCFDSNHRCFEFSPLLRLLTIVVSSFRDCFYFRYLIILYLSHQTVLKPFLYLENNW